MNYFEHNDSKGADVRRRVQINRADRAMMRAPFDGTLFMSRRDLQRRRHEARRTFYQKHCVDSMRIGFEAYGRRMGWAQS